MVLLCSCGKKEEVPSDVLLRFGDKILTFQEVVDKIPEGLMPADSAALFQNITESWIKDMVLSDLAEKRLYDINAIDRRVMDYRNSLIVQEYLSRMRETQSPKIEESRVREYYEKHRKELKLEVPLVKGVFLKISSENRGKDNISNLLMSDNPEMIDRLEQEWLDRALEYNYFRDKWIEWEIVAAMIPHRFGDPDSFLKENRYFETEYGDCSYYLRITDYLPSGEEQPYEFASSWITGLLTQGDLMDYENALVESIVTNSLKNKQLEMVGYDPIKHEIIENHVILDDE